MSRSVGELRTSQLITTFGPGAVVDLPKLSILVSGLEAWTTRDDLIVDEPRLCSALRVRGLYEPPVEDSGRRTRGTIPSRVFPRQLVCPVCRLLAPLERFRWEPRSAEFRCAEPRCQSRGRLRALPARFVMACDRGHLDDFPFHRYAHDGAESCPGPLRFLDSGTTGSIADLAVRCEATGSRRNLAAAFSERSNAIGPCTARRPWLSLDHVDPQGCRVQPWALLRGASNLYFPIVRSALSVPPWADPINQDLAGYERLLANVTTLEELQVLLRFGNLPELRDYDAEELFEALMRRRGQISSIDVGSLLIPEWQALRHPTRSAGRTDFETEEVNAPDDFQEFIEQVVLVHRLREVRALQGFTRIEPPGAWGDEPDDPARVVPPGRGRPEWLPAIVVRGEGVFIELRHETVRQWTSQPAVQTLLARMSEAQRRWRAERGLDPAPPVDPYYLLAHTLAHLLIRRMSLEAGYSASSLRERIYGSSTDDDTMIGLLVYTASTDSDGSLGGLVELGRPGRLRVLLEGALDEARLCSADPLCSDNEPRTKGMLNGAACHACLLASETSCERGNRLLDRAVLVDTLAAKEAQYFTAEQT